MRQPPGEGYGNWVGGKVSYDEDSDRFVLFFRVRRPLEEGRAGHCGVAVSDDAISFEDTWRATKEELAANSIEEGHCVKVRGRWHLYVSYEIEGTATWRIDVMTAPEPAGFATQGRRTVLEPADYGLPWIKDPFVMLRDDRVWLYAAVPDRYGPAMSGSRVTARAMDATVLARSDDGLYFPEIQYVFEAPGDDSWHGRRARINSIVEWEPGYLAFYDGGRTFFDNYEEKAGLAISPDGIEFERVSTEEPWLGAPHGRARYVSAVRARGSLYLFYEFTRDDGSHDLRMVELEV